MAACRAREPASTGVASLTALAVAVYEYAISRGISAQDAVLLSRWEAGNQGCDRNRGGGLLAAAPHYDLTSCRNPRQNFGLRPYGPAVVVVVLVELVVLEVVVELDVPTATVWGYIGQ